MLQYMSGFGNTFETEAAPGALPRGQNSPQRCPYNLFAEQLSGSAFTAPPGANLRSWLYRIRPSVQHVRKLAATDFPLWRTAPARASRREPIGQMRWGPIPRPDEATNFIEGVRMMTTAGDADARMGMGAGAYVITESMGGDCFYDADGELLFVPQEGALLVETELGHIDLAPGEIGVVPRGVKFRVQLDGAFARGYLCENYGQPFVLPNRGVVGANGLANERDFLTPVAAFEDSEGSCRLTVKWGGGFYSCNLAHSPMDVVAWHGNYAPYKYDLRRFCAVGAIRFDHPDPSIFCVLTSPSQLPGVGDVDFVIFPERWQVAEHTFRPPWFHVNVMSEFMGLIYGAYDAKPEGFVPGGMSLHNAMLPHGPDADAFERATSASLAPNRIDGALAFMFETRLPQHPTEYALTLDTLDRNYSECWSGLRRGFDMEAS